MELRNLLENASLSFSFAKDLFKHNLVRILLLLIIFITIFTINKTIQGCIFKRRRRFANSAITRRRYTRSETQLGHLLS